MATVIRVACPTEGCGEQRIQATDVTLWMEADADYGKYSFKCPKCGQIVTKDASFHIVTLLVGADVKVTRWTIPLELYDASRSSSREVISLDDVLSFHEELQLDDWVEKLIGGGWGNNE